MWERNVWPTQHEKNSSRTLKMSKQQIWNEMHEWIKRENKSRSTGRQRQFVNLFFNIFCILLLKNLHRDQREACFFQSEASPGLVLCAVCSPADNSNSNAKQQQGASLCFVTEEGAYKDKKDLKLNLEAHPVIYKAAHPLSVRFMGTMYQIGREVYINSLLIN